MFMCVDNILSSIDKVIHCQMKTNFHWRLDSHITGCFCFIVPNFWEGGGDLRMLLCHSTNAG